MRRGRLALLPLAVLLLGLDAVKLPPVPTVASVDLPRYMGRWYIIASIPTSFEKGAHNSVESYELNPTARSRPSSPAARTASRARSRR